MKSIKLGPMKYLITISVFLIACEPEFDMGEYIADSCTMETYDDYIFYISHDWNKASQQLIAESFDYVNDTFGIDLQICGFVEGIGRPETHVIAKMYNNDIVGGPNTVGNANDTKIYIWPARTRNYSHLKKVIRHELGHYLSGYGHSDDKHDVMCQGWWGVTEYSENDIENIKRGL